MTPVERWSAERVGAAAPDSQVALAAEKLAIPQPWSQVGTSGNLLWGLCQGSGKSPYQVQIDLAGPAYKCSCPSRKFPCKHAVALLHLWSQGHVKETGLAEFAAEWAAGRAARDQPKPAKDAAPRTPEQQADAAANAEARAQQRERRIGEGLTELDRWLADVTREGLAKHSAQRPKRLQALAARMVDAQAPGVATRLSALAEVRDANPNWPVLVTAEFGALRLLARAWANRAELDAELVETLRQHLGITVRADDVIADEPGVTDDWVVVGLRDSDEERVSVRRVWLFGRSSGRWALVLFFAAGGATLTSNLYPGTQVHATLHFHPGRGQLRAVIAHRDEQASPVTGFAPTAESPSTARLRWRDAVAQDPWLDSIPVLVAGELAADAAAKPAIRGAEGGMLPLVGNRDAWLILQLTAERDDVVVAGELGPTGLLPVSVLSDGAVVPL